MQCSGNDKEGVMIYIEKNRIRFHYDAEELTGSRPWGRNALRNWCAKGSGNASEKLGAYGAGSVQL